MQTVLGGLSFQISRHSSTLTASQISYTDLRVYIYCNRKVIGDEKKGERNGKTRQERYIPQLDIYNGLGCFLMTLNEDLERRPLCVENTLSLIGFIGGQVTAIYFV